MTLFSRLFHNRLLRRLLIWAGAGLLLYIAAGVGVCLWGLVEDDAPADVAVVLGNAVGSDGRLSRRFKARLDRALELYQQGRVPLIIVSGATGRQGRDEALAGTAYLASQGVPEQALVADSNGANTRATAEFTAAFVQKHNLRRVIAVSQYFHLPRCRLAFTQAGISDVGTASARYVEKRDVYSVAREIPAVAAYLVWAR